MKKKLFLVIILVLTVFLPTTVESKESDNSKTTISEVVNTSEEKPKEEQRKNPLSLKEAKKIVNEIQKKKDNILKEYVALVKKTESTTSQEALDKKAELNKIVEDYKYYLDRLAEFQAEKWESCFKEYPVATLIWTYLKNLGWSDEVCAGVLGNMMTEVGGQTLDIQYKIYDPTKWYYGICQWSKTHYAEIHDADLYTQCDYLRDTIEYEIDTFGYKYKNGMSYGRFLNASTPSEAALIFAKCYERCDSRYYDIRKTNAETAYKYFTE